MKSKRTIAMIVMSVLLVSVLSFSVYAASGFATASGTYAHAYVSSGNSDVTGYIEVYATIGHSAGWTRDEYNGTAVSASASVGSEDLPSNAGHVQAARACGWFNGASVCEDYWTD